MAALSKDSKPPIDAHRRLTARMPPISKCSSRFRARVRITIGRPLRNRGRLPAGEG
jgi:hypothetical protein